MIYGLDLGGALCSSRWVCGGESIGRRIFASGTFSEWIHFKVIVLALQIG